MNSPDVQAIVQCVQCIFKGGIEFGEVRDSMASG